jgi:hypothetical protein
VVLTPVPEACSVMTPVAEEVLPKEAPLAEEEEEELSVLVFVVVDEVTMEVLVGIEVMAPLELKVKVWS